MEDDGKEQPDCLKPANDNGPAPEGEAGSGEEIAPFKRVDRLVLDIARLIGRQMARADFERLRAATANDNDNEPRGAGQGAGEADED